AGGGGIPRHWTQHVDGGDVLLCVVELLGGVEPHAHARAGIADQRHHEKHERLHFWIQTAPPDGPASTTSREPLPSTSPMAAWVCMPAAPSTTWGWSTPSPVPTHKMGAPSVVGSTRSIWQSRSMSAA